MSSCLISTTLLCSSARLAARYGGEGVWLLQTQTQLPVQCEEPLPASCRQRACGAERGNVRGLDQAERVRSWINARGDPAGLLVARIRRTAGQRPCVNES